MALSRFLTPLSAVNSVTIFSISLSLNLMMFSLMPLDLIYLGIRYFFEISIFSLIEYPEISTTSILSSKAGWIVSSELAVAMKNTLERSKGVARK